VINRKIKNANAYGWGTENIPWNDLSPDHPDYDPDLDRKNPPRAYKFMHLHEPVTLRFGGHYHLSGSHNGNFYGPFQVALCPTAEKAKSIRDESYSPHKIPGPAGQGCECGIYSQHLDHLCNRAEFEMGTLVKLNLTGRALYTQNGFRSSHAEVLGAWTRNPMDNDQLTKASLDLRIPIKRVPNEYNNWAAFVKDTPELHDDMLRTTAIRNKWDKVIAGPCPSCGNAETKMVDSGRYNSSSRYYRVGKCPDCENTWETQNKEEY